jgi:hypothetical protein
MQLSFSQIPQALVPVYIAFHLRQNIPEHNLRLPQISPQLDYVELPCFKSNDNLLRLGSSFIHYRPSLLSWSIALSHQPQNKQASILGRANVAHFLPRVKMLAITFTQIAIAINNPEIGVHLIVRVGSM